MPQLMNIGDAARASGVTPKMVRHYESLGLIPEAERTGAGYRLYGEREVAMLRFIRQSRSLGFPIPRIDALLGLWRDQGRPSSAVKDLAQRQLAELEERQRELDRMRATLSQLVADCAGDERSHCAILDTLGSAHATAEVASPPASRALQSVAPGTRRPRVARTAAAAPRPEPVHAGLVAWSRSFSPAPAP